MTPIRPRRRRTIREKGSDFWFRPTPPELLAHYDPASDPDYPAGLDLATLRKGHDIFDVWFESGTSWNAAMRERELGFPVDLYLEGSDQHRGWFQLSLLPGLGSTGASPFKSVLTHGFIVDKDGLKMSKSGGNAIDVEELLKDFGADVCRWWVASLAFENDIKVDIAFFGPRERVLPEGPQHAPVHAEQPERLRPGEACRARRGACADGSRRLGAGAVR
jgi:isoleucyl-tRNA synthetase